MRYYISETICESETVCGYEFWNLYCMFIILQSRFVVSVMKTIRRNYPLTATCRQVLFEENVMISNATALSKPWLFRTCVMCSHVLYLYFGRTNHHTHDNSNYIFIPPLCFSS